MKKNNFFYDFFRSFLSIVFFIPPLILALGLILKFNQTKPVKEIVPSSPTPVSIKNSSSETTLNLDGPFICLLSSKEATISAFIKDKQVFMEKTENGKTSLYLLKNDCLYSWYKGYYSGQKICGLTPYFSLFTTFSSFGISNIGSTISMLPQLVSKDLLSSSSANIDSLIKSCRKKEIKDGTIFEIPKNVVFKNK